MSSPTDRIYGPGDPSPYAPRWVRGAPRRPVGEQGEPDAEAADGEDAAGTVARNEHAPPLAAAAPVASDEPFLVEEFRVPRSLDPGIVPDPWASRRARLRRSRVFGMLGRFALAGSAAAVVALVAVGKLSVPGFTGATEQAGNPTSFGSRYSGHPAKPQDPPALTEAAGDARTQAVPPQPPAGMPPVLALAPAGPPAAEPAPAATALDPNSEEVAALVKRGQELAAAGDVAAARLTLRRAAEAHNAQAALALGATYDPLVLEKLGIFGVTPDVAVARSWYEKAKEYGSAEAPRRLELLAARAP